MDQISEIERGGQDLSSFAMLLLESELRDADVNSYPTDMVCDGPFQPLNSPRGIRNFFRKRHKSVGSNGAVENNHIGNFPSVAKDDNSSSKIRNLFGPPRMRSKNEVNHNIIMSSSVPRNGCRNDMERTTFAMEVEDQAFGDGGYGSVPKSPTYLHNVYKTPERHAFARRSVSIRDSPIGPDEFLEMYRSRAYSDTRLPDRPSQLKDRFRRFSASPPFTQNLLNDYCPFEPKQLIIWRDNQNGNKVFRLPSTDEEEGIDIGDFDNCEELIYIRFLKLHSCYDIIPTSTKLVILDTQLNVKKAFYALMNNSVRAAPLWDTGRQNFIGMLTISDFIKVLLKLHKAQQLSNIEDIEEHTISKWTEMLSDYRNKPLVFIEPDASMLEAVRKLCLHKIHRLPVIDPLTGNVLYILTHKRLLRYVYCVFHSLGLSHPAFMDSSLEELHVGTYGNIAVVQPGTELVIALELFASRRVSSLPVVDGSGKLLGLFTKNHVMNLAGDKTYSKLSETVGKLLATKDIESVQTCCKKESLGVILERLVRTEVHRLIIVNSRGHVEGVLSLSDVLRYLVLRPPVSSTGDAFKEMPQKSSFP